MTKIRKITTGTLIVLFLMFLGIQALPGGLNHQNPPVSVGPDWDSPETEALARRACFDCHSNETKWPWYASIAPISWRVEQHVDMGRRHMNFSEWDKPQRHAHEAAEEVEEDHMPLYDYLWLHPEARLSEAEKQALIRGLRATMPERRQRQNSTP